MQCRAPFPLWWKPSRFPREQRNKGFDWPKVEEVLQKLDEERAELAQSTTEEEREEELGDMLFTVVNLARFLKVDPEQALRRTNAKFRQRFAFVEHKLEARKRVCRQIVWKRWRFWQEAKQ